MNNFLRELIKSFKLTAELLLLTWAKFGGEDGLSFITVFKKANFFFIFLKILKIRMDLPITERINKSVQIPATGTRT